MEGKVSKTARKRSMDPAQEHLREQKHVWSEATSNFITRLIAFKRVLNGQKDPRIALEPVKIQFPLSEGTGSALNQLATEFEAIINGWTSIIDEQKRYSETRRKPIQHVPGGMPSPANQQQQPTQPVAAADDGLSSEASWWGSRFMAGLPLVGLTGKDAQLLKTMLNEAATMEDQLMEMENALTSSSANSIADAFLPASYMASGSLDVFMNAWLKLLKGHGKTLDLDGGSKILPARIERGEGTVPAQPPPSPAGDALPVAAVEPSAPEVSHVQPIEFTEEVIDFYRNESFHMKRVFSFLEKENLIPKSSELRKYKRVAENVMSISLLLRNPDRTPEVEKQIQTSINTFMMAYSSLLDLAKLSLKVPSANSFADLLPSLVKQPLAQTTTPLKADDLSFVKDAANPFSRMMKRWWLRNKPRLLQDNRFHAKKVEAVAAITNAIENVDKLMNSLEQKGNTPGPVASSINIYATSLVLVFDHMLDLAEIHNTMFLEESFNAKRPSRVIHSIQERFMLKLNKGKAKATILTKAIK